MEPGRHDRGRGTRDHILDDGPEHRHRVDDEGVRVGQARRIVAVLARGGQALQLDGCLALVADRVAYPEHGGDRVEQAPGAGGDVPEPAAAERGNVLPGRTVAANDLQARRGAVESTVELA